MSDDIEALKEAEKENFSFTDTDADFAPPHTPHAHHVTHKREESDNWLGGVILITVGGVFLLTTVLGYSLQNWWALFILIPGLSKLVHATQTYRRDGRFSHRARHNFTWGLILTLVAFTFFFSWSWSAIWPVFLIIFGVGALLSGLLGN